LQTRHRERSRKIISIKRGGEKHEDMGENDHRGSMNVSINARGEIV